MNDFLEHQHKDCEYVPIKVNRVFDSCSDRDCFNDIEVSITGGLPSAVNVVKTKCAEVSAVCINVEPIKFNRGCYSVDITFTFDLDLVGYTATPCSSTAIPLSGKAYVSKNVILFGSEVNTKTFYSDGTDTQGEDSPCCQIVNLPTASVQLVSPIVLETRIGRICHPTDCIDDDDTVTITKHGHPRGVFVTIGLFTVVELSRNVTLYVKAYPNMISQKTCCCDNDTPCEIFDRIEFPVDEFSPSGTITDEGAADACSCCDN